MRAAGRVLAALVVASASVLLPAAAAPAAAAEACVGVVVDARLLGGGVRTGCATGDPTSGLQALTRAGFSYAFLPRQPGLVCQVDRTPECSRTSTTTYWSYWYRAKGAGAWTYSPVGAGSRDPQPGSTEAWVWQDGGRREPPDVAFATLCPQARSDSPAKRSGGATSAPDGSRSSARSNAASTSSPPAATRRTSEDADGPDRTKRKDDADGTASGRPGPGTPTQAPDTSETSATASASPAPATPSTSPTPSDGPSTTAAAAGRPASAATDASGADDGGPGPLGLVVGLALVASLATAAVLRARRPDGSP